MDVKEYIKALIKKNSRVFKDKRDKRNLKNKDFSIFASNCIGGIIYHNLGERFLSPTVNLWIKPSDYIKMLANPEHYFTPGKMKEFKNSNTDFPVGIIDDIKIFGVHYSSFNQLEKKWDERCTRINWDNVIVFMIQRDGATHDDLIAFDKLPYAKKVVFTKKNYQDIKSGFVLPNTYDVKNNNVNNLCIFKNGHSNIRVIDEFDYVDFINTGRKKVNLKYKWHNVQNNK